MRFQIQLIPAQTCLLNCLPLATPPGSPLTRTTESFALRIDGSTASIHSLCLRICVQRKVISRAACQFTIFFCWLGLLFQMPILGIGLDDMPAERIAYVWVDAHLLQAPFCGANLCFLLAFCEWSGLAEGENKAQAYLFHWLYGRWLVGWRSIPWRKGGQGSKTRPPPHTHPPRYFSTWDQKPFPPLLLLQKAPAPGVMAQLWALDPNPLLELSLLFRSGAGARRGRLGFPPEQCCHIMSHGIIFVGCDQH